jgi:hypothetical protein
MEHLKLLVAHWRSPGGKYWVDLYESVWLDQPIPVLTYSYATKGGGGNLGPYPTRQSAIDDMEHRLPMFNADAAKHPLKRNI